jgi:hypothetical protein
MGIGLQAIQLSPYHAGLAEQRFQRLLSVLSFVGRLLSPRPFGVRLAADPRMSSESFPSAMGMLHELLRRTGGFRTSGGARLAKLISFDIDGTLEVGDPPGSLTMAMVRRAKD